MNVIPGLRELTNEVNTLNEGLTKLESQITFLNTVMSSMERQTSGLRTNVGELNSRADTLSGNVDGLNTTLATLGQILASLSLIIFQINKVVELFQFPLKMLAGASSVIGGGIEVLFDSVKIVSRRAEGLARTVESLTLPASDDTRASDE